ADKEFKDWADKPIVEITEKRVKELIEGIRDERGSYAARHAFAAARLIFKWAKADGKIAVNPVAELEPAMLYSAPAQRDRVLSDAELRRVWRAADETEYPFGPIIKLLVLTGARRSEIAEMRWSELRGDLLVLSADRTKMKIGHTIPLCATAMQILDSLPRC